MKIWMLVTAGALVAAGCSSKKSSTENQGSGSGPVPSPGSGSDKQPEPDKPDKSVATPQAKLDRYVDCWKQFNTGKDERFVECFALDASRIQVDSVPDLKAQGQDKILEMVRAQKKAFPDLTITPIYAVANGNEVAAVLHVGGTNTGEFGGLPATKKPIGLFEAQIVTIGDDGLISADTFYLDQLTIYHQIGVLENESSPNKQDKPADTKLSADAPADATKQTLDKFFEALNRKDLGALEALAADDIKFVAHGERTKVEGKKAYAKWLKETLATTKDTKVAPTQTVIAGDLAVTAETFTGTTTKNVPGTSNTKGKQIETHYAEFFQIADGKIQQLHMFPNNLKTAVELGVVDPDQLAQMLSGGAE